MEEGLSADMAYLIRVTLLVWCDAHAIKVPVCCTEGVRDNGGFVSVAEGCKNALKFR